MTHFTFSGGLRLVAVCLLTSGLSGCFRLDDDPGTCSANVLAPALRLASTRTGQVGTPVEVRYTVQITNECGKFKSLEQQRNGNNIYLSPLVTYEGCVCPEVATEYNGTYTFTPTTAGTYVVHMLQASNGELTDTLRIQ